MPMANPMRTGTDKQDSAKLAKHVVGLARVGGALTMDARTYVQGA